MCTGGRGLFKGKGRGAVKLTPSRGKNHILPSVDVATRGVLPLVNEWLLTPSENSKTVNWIGRFGSAAQASNSGRAMRTTPQAMYSQNEWVLSSTTHLTA